MNRACLVAALLWLTAGCASNYVGTYDAAHVPAEEPEHISSGGALLVVEDSQKDYVFSGHPSSFTGWALSLTIELGSILTEVSREVLEDRFAGGVSLTNEFVGASDVELVIQPEIEHYEYRWNQLRNYGLEVTPQVEVSVRVRARDASGIEIHDAVHESGTVSGDNVVFEMSNRKMKDKITVLTHTALYDVLEKAVDQVIAEASLSAAEEP